MSKWHGGKGSNPRPVEDRKQFEDNWDRIFGRTTAKIHQDGLSPDSDDIEKDTSQEEE